MPGGRDAAARLREICLALPGAEEVGLRRGPTYRISGKIFALERRAGAALALWCKVPPGAQAMLIEAAPDRFFSPPYYGTKGWIGVRLGANADWREIAGLVERSFGLVARR